MHRITFPITRLITKGKGKKSYQLLLQLLLFVSLRGPIFGRKSACVDGAKKPIVSFAIMRPNGRRVGSECVRCVG